MEREDDPGPERDDVAHRDDQAPVDDPAPVRRPAALLRRERRIVALAAIAPIGLAAVVLLPVALYLGASAADVVGASLLYGGLVGAAAAFVAVDRFHARQCPRCREHTERGTTRCPACAYDLQERPRYACTEGHQVYLDAGLCACGRRLQPLPTARGVGPQVRFMVKIGVWLLAFLIGVGLLLQVLDRTV